MYPQWVPTYNPPTLNNPLLGTDYIPEVESFGEGIFLDIDIQNVNVRERYVFVHTFSHIIMKEMEFQCGYPLSSLKEKMYKKGADHYGILIYTIGGSEGSYGGLISLLPTDPAATNGGKLVTLIENALERVKIAPTTRFVWMKVDMDIVSHALTSLK